MLSYNNAKCISCNNPFVENDDIVVCPECGTPYHRSCYEKEGKCINVKAHESGESWKPEYENEFEGQESVACKRCGEKNPPMNIFCNGCGATLNEENNPFGNMGNFQGTKFNDNKSFGPFGNVQMINDSSILEDDVSVEEAKNFIGGNPFYFLIQFINFSKTKKKLSLNLTAMLFPEFYFFYRKMHGIGLIVYILRFIATIPSIVLMFSPNEEQFLAFFTKLFSVQLTDSAIQSILIAANVILYATMFFCGIFANYLYYKKCIRVVKSAKSAAKDDQEFKNAIIEKGGTSKVALAVSIGALFVLSYLIVYLMSKV